MIRAQVASEEQRLFTGDGRPYCKSCRTTRANLCRHDADLRHEAIDRTHRRPADCLNHPQNRDGVPY